MSNDYRNRSKERLRSETGHLLKDLMVSCLDRAEKILRPNLDSPKWQQFRFEILNLGNDKQRQLDDRFADYTIEFRPQIIFSVKYIGEDHKSAVDISNFEFTFVKDEPNIKITLLDNQKNVEALRKVAESIRSGVVFQKDGKVTYEVWGLASIFLDAIPFFDSNKCFKGKTLERYEEWKEQVYELEGKGNVKETNKN
jgi:hypothetical protein